MKSPSSGMHYLGLDEVYKDTVEMTDAILEQIPGKETIEVDGFKDRNVPINISKAKVGFASYLKTSWFGRLIRAPLMPLKSRSALHKRAVCS